ncbi:hypothetical protein [Catenuloplanes japonicus]|uniref:hypothetical protein n=1 Tax=Catenuloplanes japonicus TaxID=33876 RepID=UPI0012F8F4CA|nr:hypothetical protein [Catenuloplanes japonicus]
MGDPLPARRPHLLRHGRQGGRRRDLLARLSQRLAVDLCDLEWGTTRQDATARARIGDDWAIITRFSQPTPDRFDRDLTTFVRGEDGTYRREDEHHRNILIDTSPIPALLRERGVTATIGSSFNDATHPLPVGLRSVIGHKP